MNWTGGRLQRHSKAKANHLLNAQKQCFAKARQSLQKRLSPTSPQAFSIFEAQVPTRSQHDSNQTLQPPRHQLKPSHERHRLSPHLEQAELTVTVYLRSEGEADEHSGQTFPRPAISPHPLPTANINPLDQIKRKLLERSDWAGVAVVKPLSVAFTPAEEMERIGRRRKVTREERKRKTQGPGQQTLHRNSIRPFRSRQSESTGPAPDPTDLSIRIGSNIHQTLTTQSSVREVDHCLAPQSEAAESMLLDKFETTNLDDLRLPNMNVEPSHQASHPQGQGYPESGDLMPLSQARHFNSFDHVLERSSSVVRQVVPSSTPFGAPPASHQRLVRGSQDDPSLTPSVNESHLNERCKSMSRERTGPMGVSTGAASSNSMEYLRAGAVIRHEHFRDTKTEVNETRPDAKMSLMDQPEQRPYTVDHNPPKFTLEHQVAFERDIHEKLRKSTLRTHAALERASRGSSDVRRHGLHLAAPPPHYVFTGGESGIGSEAQRAYSPNSSVPASDAVLRNTALTRRLKPSNDRLHDLEVTERISDYHPTRTKYLQRPETRPASWMGKFQLAKEEHQASMRQTKGHTEGSRSSSRRLVDDNEAWMKFVFPKDFDRIQTDFTFGMAAPPRELSHFASLSSLNDADRSLFSSSGSSNWASEPARPSAISAPTAANTTIFDPRWARNASANNSLTQSETDFLSRFSPMQGVMDERLEHMSMYNNAAATTRSLLSLPHARAGHAHNTERMFHDSARLITPAKRRAADEVDGPTHCRLSEWRPPKKTRTPLRPLPQPIWRVSQQQLHCLETSKHPQRTPLHVTGSTRADHESSVSSDSVKHTRSQREAVFPLAYSPASSRSNPSNQSTIGSPSLQHLKCLSSNNANQNVLTKTPSASSRQSLWQVSMNAEDTIPDLHGGNKRLLGSGMKERLHGPDRPHPKSTPPPLPLSLLRRSTAASTGSRYF